MKLDYGNMTARRIGKLGIDRLELPADAFDKVNEGLDVGWQEWSKLPLDEELNEIEEFCAPIGSVADSIVVLGIGGSALGAAAIAGALLHLRHNELPYEKRNAPKFYVEDNIDPERMQALLDVIDVAKSYFVVITKSGETSETLSQFLIIYNELTMRLGDKAARHIIAVTTIGKGTLYALAQREGFKIFGIGQGVGGRFSVFSPVGLVPLCLVGIDIKGLIMGARKARAYCTERSLDNPALIMAALNIEEYRRGCNISVLMPYADSLKLFSDFYAQLWGESLGKKENLEGETVNVGQTPVKALGVTDQHSQIQLFTEGPFDKTVTFIEVGRFRSLRVIPDDKRFPGLEFLKGHTLNELIGAECAATAFALRKAGRPNMTVYIDEVSPITLGELIMLFMFETAYAGALLGIDAYNQPGVEEGKRATFAMMGRDGYKDKLSEMTAPCGEYLIERD